MPTVRNLLSITNEEFLERSIAEWQKEYSAIMENPTNAVSIANFEYWANHAISFAKTLSTNENTSRK